MTREDAIDILFGVISANSEEENEALDMAVEALEGVRFDEWCDDCKEYDTEKKCCPRFNRVIRGAMKREPNADGTLEVKVEDATKIGRVLISDDKHRGGLYYPDEYEPKGEDLISRNEAFEVLAEILDENHVPIWICDKMAFAIDAIPSADRPMVIKCKPFLSEEDFKAFAEQVSDQNVILIPNEAEVVSTNTSTNTSTKLTNISTDTSADRPRGEWVSKEGVHGAAYCSECDYELRVNNTNFCPNCGVDMRGEKE